jgi:hypothetical protein
MISEMTLITCYLCDLIPVEWLGRLVQVKGSRIRVPVVTCSPEQLDWFVTCRVVCGLPVIRAPKIPLGSFEKNWGISPILAEAGITGPHGAQPQ